MICADGLVIMQAYARSLWRKNGAMRGVGADGTGGLLGLNDGALGG